MNRLFWITSQKGNQVPVIDNFVYRHKGKGNNGKVYWKCSHALCKARATTFNGEVFKVTGMHMHNSDFDVVLKSEMKDIMQRKMMMSPFLSANELYNDAVKVLCEKYQFGSDTFARIVSFDSVKTSIYRWKSYYMPFTGILDPAIFNIAEFELPNGRNFLLTRVIEGDKCIILWDFELLRRFTLSWNLHVMMDGTFKSSSSSFYQVYIKHGSFNRQRFPLVYCFLANKTTETYVNTFNLLTSSLERHGISFCPSLIQIDFEVAAYNAIKMCFLTAEVKGCFFHFGQAFWRHVKGLRLVNLYNQSSQFSDLYK